MGPLQKLFWYLLILGLQLFAVLSVMREANRLKSQGLDIQPWAWGLFTFTSCGVALPVFLINRATSWAEFDKPQAQPQAPKYGVACSCGQQLKVSAASAGQSVDCSCGRAVSVPPLSELRAGGRIG